MIIFNTTFHINKEILEEALTYLKKNYIPEVTAEGILLQPSLRRIMHTSDEGENYAVQFHIADMDALSKWLDNRGKSIHQALTTRFGDRMSGFTTLMEELDWRQ